MTNDSARSADFSGERYFICFSSQRSNFNLLRSSHTSSKCCLIKLKLLSPGAHVVVVAEGRDGREMNTSPGWQ